MEQEIVQENTNTVARPISNSSSWEKVHPVEVSETNNNLEIGMISEIKVEKAGDASDAISCRTSCLENTSYLKARVLAVIENSELSSCSGQAEEDSLAFECQTPTGSVFDPFAPGPEELACAPKKKLVKESRIPLRRQLNFDSCISSVQSSEIDVVDDATEEKQFSESVYQSVLEIVLSNHFEEISSEGCSARLNSFIKTPTSLPPLTGVLETCPAAPLRHGLKSRRLSPSICRKLQF